MVGVAVNVTDVPEQIVVAVDVILTPAGEGLFTVIVIPLDVAGFPSTPPRFEVITHVTVCPEVNVVVV